MVFDLDQGGLVANQHIESISPSVHISLSPAILRATDA